MPSKNHSSESDVSPNYTAKVFLKSKFLDYYTFLNLISSKTGVIKRLFGCLVWETISVMNKGIMTTIHRDYDIAEK